MVSASLPPTRPLRCKHELTSLPQRCSHSLSRGSRRHRRRLRQLKELWVTLSKQPVNAGDHVHLQRRWRIRLHSCSDNSPRANSPAKEPQAAVVFKSEQWAGSEEPRWPVSSWHSGGCSYHGRTSPGELKDESGQMAPRSHHRFCPAPRVNSRSPSTRAIVSHQSSMRGPLSRVVSSMSLAHRLSPYSSKECRVSIAAR